MPVEWPSLQRMDNPQAPTSSASSTHSSVVCPGRGQDTSPRSRWLRHVAHGQMPRSSSSPSSQTAPSSKVNRTERRRSMSMSVTLTGEAVTASNVAVARSRRYVARP